MAGKRKSNARKMRPQFLVLCEGETEANYVSLLKQNYRLPIKIVSRIVGSNISPRIIEQHKKGLGCPPDSVRTFLMYDGDIAIVVDNLKKCKGFLLISSPCVEIWFAAHYRIPTDKELTGDGCVKYLKTIPGWENYKKAIFTVSQENALWEKRMTAVKNMKSKVFGSRNFSNIFEFVNILETEKRN